MPPFSYSPLWIANCIFHCVAVRHPDYCNTSWVWQIQGKEKSSLSTIFKMKELLPKWILSLQSQVKHRIFIFYKFRLYICHKNPVYSVKGCRSHLLFVNTVFEVGPLHPEVLDPCTWPPIPEHKQRRGSPAALRKHIGTTNPKSCIWLIALFLFSGTAWWVSSASRHSPGRFYPQKMRQR